MAGIVAGRGERRDSGAISTSSVDVLETVDERCDTPCGRVGRSCLERRERDGVAMDEIAGSREERRPSRSVFHPTWSMCRWVRKTMSTVLRRTPSSSERLWNSTLLLGCPAPETRRPDTGVDEHGDVLGADEVALARQAPAPAREELRVQRADTAPTPRETLRVRVRVLGERPRPRRAPLGARSSRLPRRALAPLAAGPGQLEKLGLTLGYVSQRHGRAVSKGQVWSGMSHIRRTYQRTRGGAGWPWASSQETIGLRRTPIRSISASITSPGRR